jgi:hypothetical protein
MWTPKEVESVINMLRIADQFDAEPDIPYHLLDPEEIARYTKILSRERYHLSLAEMKECDLPEGIHRKEHGKGGRYS